MNTLELANKLVHYCRENKESQAYEELYSPDIVSVEMTEPMKEVHGFNGIKKKGAWWEENFEVHSTTYSDPLVADNHFTIAIDMDTTHKPSNTRSQMRELAVYQVKDSKIIREQFFYDIEE